MGTALAWVMAAYMIYCIVVILIQLICPLLGEARGAPGARRPRATSTTFASARFGSASFALSSVAGVEGSPWPFCPLAGELPGQLQERGIEVQASNQGYSAPLRYARLRDTLSLLHRQGALRGIDSDPSTMARIVHSDLTRLALSGGHAPEVETLATLRDTLPGEYTVFHGVHWTRPYKGRPCTERSTSW